MCLSRQTGAYDQLNYNTTGRCDAPLVRTEKRDSWWEGLEGCGVQCQSPLYSHSEHRQAHVFVAVMGALCLISTLFTIVSTLVCLCLMDIRGVVVGGGGGVVGVVA